MAVDDRRRLASRPSCAAATNSQRGIGVCERVNGSTRAAGHTLTAKQGLTDGLEALLHGVLQPLDVAHGHGQRRVSNQPERLDRWYGMPQPYAQSQAGIRSEGDAAVHE